MTVLNTTLNQKANGLFNKTRAYSGMIPAMKKQATEIHPQMQRLYVAAKELRKRETKADVARLLHVSDQVLNGWETRGISSRGLLDTASALGINHAWLRDGTGDMLTGIAPVSQGGLDDVADLIKNYGRLATTDRDMVLRFVRSLLPSE